MVRWPDVFDPGTGILDRLVNVSYSRMNRIICTYSHWDNHFYIQGSGRIAYCRFHNALKIIQRT